MINSRDGLFTRKARRLSARFEILFPEWHPSIPLVNREIVKWYVSRSTTQGRA